MDQRARWRSQLGASAAWWSSKRHIVDDDLWVAFSGQHSTELNLALCSGRDVAIVERSLEEAGDLGSPTVIMLGGEALGSAQVLVDAGWVCVGVAPFMRLDHIDDTRIVGDTAVRRLTPADLEAARAVVSEAYNDEAGVVGLTALADNVMASDSVSVWGVEAEGELVTVVVASATEEATGIWFMGTRPAGRRMGYARRLFNVVLHDAFSSGSSHVLLHASEQAAPLYGSMGFVEVEPWQLWSRPRWIPGRT